MGLSLSQMTPNQLRQLADQKERRMMQNVCKIGETKHDLFLLNGAADSSNVKVREWVEKYYGEKIKQLEEKRDTLLNNPTVPKGSLVYGYRDEHNDFREDKLGWWSDPKCQFIRYQDPDWGFEHLENIKEYEYGK